jgi:hypothetical protein
MSWFIGLKIKFIYFILLYIIMSISQKGHVASISNFNANTLFSDKKCGSSSVNYILLFFIIVLILYLLHNCLLNYQQKHIIEYTHDNKHNNTRKYN